MLGRVVATLRRNRRFDGLAVQHTAGRAGLAPGTLTAEHQRHVLDGLEHQVAHEAVKPSVERLPMRSPAAASPATNITRQVAARVQDFA
jgi:hypothetical protein